jgi:hypothetical protein
MKTTRRKKDKKKNKILKYLMYNYNNFSFSRGRLLMQQFSDHPKQEVLT